MAYAMAIEVALLEQRQVDDRVLFRQLPDDECRETDCRNDSQHNDRARREPVEILALVQHHLKRRDPDD
jgi:hypothetical protein